MSIQVTLAYEGIDLTELREALGDSTGLNARVAGDAEKFLKREGPRIAADKHRTADKLGANPTGHLTEAYEGIEGISDANSATLLIPSASRLRAAFGTYVLTPKNAKFLTIPAHKDAYGKRAGEFDDLFFMRVGPRKTPVLARRVEGTEDRLLRARPYQRRDNRRVAEAEILYVLARKAIIPEDPTLIPMDALSEEARDSAEAYLDELIERSLA